VASKLLLFAQFCGFTYMHVQVIVIACHIFSLATAAYAIKSVSQIFERSSTVMFALPVPHTANCKYFGPMDFTV
jgi:hypothetical protein